MLPTLAFPPTIPFTLQVTAVSEVPVTTAVYCAESPSMTVVAPESATVTLPPPGGLGGAASLTVRLRETAGSATLVAVIVTDEDLGIVAGAL
jgi:hypothetical protein